MRGIDRILEMTGERCYLRQFGSLKSGVIALIRRELSHRSWLRWRKHVNSRMTKHVLSEDFVKEGISQPCKKSISINKLGKKESKI